MKEKFWTKRFIITLIILGLIFVSLILSLSFSFGKNVKNNSSQLTVHFANEEKVYSEKEVNKFLLKKDQEYFPKSNSNLSSFYNLGDGEDSDSSTDVYQYSTQSEEYAAIILKEFLQTSLTGADFLSEVDENTEILPGSILNPTEDDDWLTSEYINTPNYEYDIYYQLTDHFAKIKLFFDTTLPTSEDMYQYIEAFATKYYDMINIPGIIDFVTTEFPKNVWDVLNYYEDNNDQASYQQLLSFLNNTIEYQTEIAKSLFVYSYLWQKDPKDDFDYFLTEEMYFDRPMFIWSIEYDNISRSNQPTDEITVDNWNTIYPYDGTYANSDGTSTAFLDEINKSYQKSYLENNDQSLRGFEGIVSTSTANLYTSSSFTDFNQYYNYKYDVNDNDGIEQVSLITDSADKENQFGKLNIYKPDYFYSPEDETWKTTANGTVVKIKVDDTPDDGTDTVSQTNLTDLPSDIGKYTGYSYIYYPMFPFVFAENYHDDSQNVQQYFYQLKVIDNGDGTYSPYDETLDNQSTLLFDVLYEQYISNGNTLTYPLEDVVYYFVYSIYINQKDTLLSSAYTHWNNEGFYLVLQGDLKDQYGSLLPQEIQRDK
ncbi:/ / hypothetical protein / 513018:514826 Reverse [Candidatus Hepatoplasma crinochetorum]|uniref:Uncharacterized protein n=1 Tax=Candidatus Hepatoplasma crinochetorum TaxID=295596 RepID=A0A0G7ZLK5_9MOLU|nr:/ / hypothetical protein / 513018:514826 Reverse [Candidatus Hepatoplasma crinochetorum]